MNRVCLSVLANRTSGSSDFQKITGCLGLPYGWDDVAEPRRVRNSRDLVIQSRRNWHNNTEKMTFLSAWEWDFLGHHPVSEALSWREDPRAMLWFVKNPAGVPKSHWFLTVVVLFPVG